MGIQEKLKEAKEKSKPRKFAQTWDLIFTLKNVDLKKPENRFNLDFSLPEGLGKPLKTAFIVDSLAPEAKKGADLVIIKAEIPELGRDKKKLKKLAKEYDWWYGEATIMPLIGKELGVVLGSRGKMPKPVPPKMSLQGLIEKSKSSVRIRVTNTPVIQVKVGTETMPDEKVVKNIESVYDFIKERLPKGKSSIRAVTVKLTMGKPVRLEFK